MLREVLTACRFTARRRDLVAVAAVAILGCGGSGAGTGGSGGAGAGGQGHINGHVGDHASNSVAASYFIGKSDDPAHTVVIYVLDAPVACADLGAAGWDTKVPDATGTLEMKLIGLAPGKYPVAIGPNPGQGEAAVNFTVTSTMATPAENAAQSGTVQLDTLEPGQQATGSFDLVFATGWLNGAFDASWCPGGHEP